jgi:hypothetical protein
MVTLHLSVNLDFDKRPDEDIKRIVVRGIETWLETCKKAEFIEDFSVRQS